MAKKAATVEADITGKRGMDGIADVDGRRDSIVNDVYFAR
jgi:hypothetical protein